MREPVSLALLGPGMAEFPRKITDDPYGAAILICRLVMEQGAAYWRRYLQAFLLMGVAAGATSLSAYILGEVINKAYVDKNIPGIALFSGDHLRTVPDPGRRALRTDRDALEDLQRHPRQQPAPPVRQADERKRRLLLRAAFVRISRAAHPGRELRHAGAQPADQRASAAISCCSSASSSSCWSRTPIWRCWDF